MLPVRFSTPSPYRHFADNTNLALKGVRTVVPSRSIRFAAILSIVLFIALPASASDGAAKKAPSPDLVLRTLDDSESLQLKTLRGYPVLLSFWASWCAPCREELPQLAELAVELGDNGFFLAAVNVDQAPAVGREFLQRYNISVPAFKVSRGDLALMGIDALPTNILLNGDGELVKVFKGLTPTLMDDLRKLVGAMRPSTESSPDGT